MLRTLLRAALPPFMVTLLGVAAPSPSTLAAQTAVSARPTMPLDRDALHAPGRDVKIYLLTMGDGPRVWEMFGHSSIWIRDTVAFRDTVVNWGVFDSTQPNFIPHFLKGLMLYSIGGNRMEDVLYSYRYWNRSVTSQELNLTATQKDSLLHVIQRNFLPDNFHYRYDYFVDNCSTRPRDILDMVLGGQLRIGADSLSGTSYRDHALRLMQSNVPLVLGVDIGLGEPSDRPITKWQTMFLPKQLHDWVATRQIRDSTGALRPLALSDRVLVPSTQPPERETPPKFTWLWLAGGLLAALFAALGIAGRDSHAARAGAAVLFSTWATICGLLGVLVGALWAFTDHRFAHANENVLLFNPLWLILAVTVPLTLLRGRAKLWTIRVLGVCVGLAALALLMHLVGLSRQTNLPIVGLVLLPAAVMFAIIRRSELAGRVASANRAGPVNITSPSPT